MVVIHIKNNDQDGFLYETECKASCDIVIREIVAIWNMRVRLAQLACSLRELAKYGPMKHPNKAGLDHIEEELNQGSVEKGQYYVEDPSGLRTGNGAGPQVAETMERVALDAEAAIDKNTVTRKIPMTMAFLQEKLDNIRGSVMMGYPMGLPEWDTVRLTIESDDGLAGTSAGQSILDPNTAELWVASRIFDRNTKISDRLGNNEKTKVIAKLQKQGGGCPGREAVVSEEEKKAMMAFYFKKQEEMKKLAESSEDDYLNSVWADPKQLQRSLRGQDGNIRAPGLR